MDYSHDPIQLATLADVETLDHIMQFTTQNLPNRDWFFDDDIDFIRRHINSDSGYTLKYMVDGEIAGFLIIRYPGSDEDNLGCYLDLPDDQLAYVAHMESTCVLPQYRGRRIFQQLTARAQQRGQDSPDRLGMRAELLLPRGGAGGGLRPCHQHVSPDR